MFVVIVLHLSNGYTVIFIFVLEVSLGFYCKLFGLVDYRYKWNFVDYCGNGYTVGTMETPIQCF